VKAAKIAVDNMHNIEEDLFSAVDDIAEGLRRQGEEAFPDHIMEEYDSVDDAIEEISYALQNREGWRDFDELDIDPGLLSKYDDLSAKLDEAEDAYDATQKAVDKAANKIFSRGRAADMADEFEDALPDGFALEKLEYENSGGEFTALTYDGEAVVSVNDGNVVGAVERGIINARDLMVRNDITPDEVVSILSDPAQFARASANISKLASDEVSNEEFMKIVTGGGK